MQNNDALSALLNEAGKKAGVNPATLKQNVQNGKLDALLANMKPQDAKRFQEILNNPALAKIRQISRPRRVTLTPERNPWGRGFTCGEFLLGTQSEAKS